MPKGYPGTGPYSRANLKSNQLYHAPSPTDEEREEHQRRNSDLTPQEAAARLHAYAQVRAEASDEAITVTYGDPDLFEWDREQLVHLGEALVQVLGALHMSVGELKAAYMTAPARYQKEVAGLVGMVKGLLSTSEVSFAEPLKLYRDMLEAAKPDEVGAMLEEMTGGDVADAAGEGDK